MNAIVTVVGMDQVGIISCVSQVLAEANVNIKDVSQTIMGECFTMMMLVDLMGMKGDLDFIQYQLQEAGEALGVNVGIQREEVFRAMHRVEAV